MRSTVTELRNLMKQYAEPSDLVDGEVEDKTVIWFTCIREAKNLSEAFSLKDLASMVNDGSFPKVNCLEDVQVFLDTMYDDIESVGEEYVDTQLTMMVTEFFNHPSADDWANKFEELANE